MMLSEPLVEWRWRPATLYDDSAGIALAHAFGVLASKARRPPACCRAHNPSAHQRLAQHHQNQRRPA